MRAAFDRGRWNLAVRRAQEVVELVTKALLNQIGVEAPKTHDPAPVLIQAVRDRGVALDASFLEWLPEFSAHLASVRAAAFYQEMEMSETEAREAVAGAERILGVGGSTLDQLRDR